METTAEAVPAAGQEQTATSSPATRSTLSLDKEKFSSHNASLEDLNVDAAGGAALPVSTQGAEPEQPVERHDKVNKNTLVIVLSLCVCLSLFSPLTPIPALHFRRFLFPLTNYMDNRFAFSCPL
jgi:hypothetical protein